MKYKIHRFIGTRCVVVNILIVYLSLCLAMLMFCPLITAQTVWQNRLLAEHYMSKNNFAFAVRLLTDILQSNDPSVVSIDTVYLTYNPTLPTNYDLGYDAVNTNYQCHKYVA
jgi:hypothetical protein